MTTQVQNAAIIAVAEALLDAVKVAGDHGAPGGVMYAALLGRLSLSQFESLMSGLVQLGCVRKNGHVYHYLKPLRAE